MGGTGDMSADVPVETLADAGDPLAAVVPLTAPRDGLPAVVGDPPALADAVARVAAGSGPVAVDAERASGFRYGQRAFLVQLRREGTGTVLIDSDALPDLTPLQQVIGDVEWVLHAAGQDLPCLGDLGLRPSRVFDTELAARLLGMPRVGLATVTQELLGLGLAKEHSAVDWSTRPLPEPWLRYAALDVEVLLELRDVLSERLRHAGKDEWAAQEFAAVAAAAPPRPRVDPWRRTSGMHRVRTRRQLAELREMWEYREELARRRDVSPGRVIPDRALVEAVARSPVDLAALQALPVFGGRATRKLTPEVMAALQRARALPEKDLPRQHLPGDGPPPPRTWADRDPAAAARWEVARAGVRDHAEELGLPVENLLTPDTLRRLVWAPPDPADHDAVAAALSERGARPWQVAQVTDLLVAALATPTPVSTPGQASDPAVTD